MDINNISFNLVALGAFNNQKSNEKTDDILISPEQLFSSKTHLSGLQSGEIPASIFNIQENAFPPIRTESFKNNDIIEAFDHSIMANGPGNTENRVNVPTPSHRVPIAV